MPKQRWSTVRKKKAQHVTALVSRDTQLKIEMGSKHDRINCASMSVWVKRNTDHIMKSVMANRHYITTRRTTSTSKVEWIVMWITLQTEGNHLGYNVRESQTKLLYTMKQNIYIIIKKEVKRNWFQEKIFKLPKGTSLLLFASPELSLNECY